MTALFQLQGNPPPVLTYEWVKNDDGTPTTLGSGQAITLPAELAEGTDCEVLQVCSGRSLPPAHP